MRALTQKPADIVLYEEGVETIALLKLLAMGIADVDAGRICSISEVKAYFSAKGAARCVRPGAERVNLSRA